MRLPSSNVSRFIFWEERIEVKDREREKQNLMLLRKVREREKKNCSNGTVDGKGYNWTEKGKKEKQATKERESF